MSTLLAIASGVAYNMSGKMFANHQAQKHQLNYIDDSQLASISLLIAAAL